MNNSLFVLTPKSRRPQAGITARQNTRRQNSSTRRRKTKTLITRRRNESKGRKDQRVKVLKGRKDRKAESAAKPKVHDILMIVEDSNID